MYMGNVKKVVITGATSMIGRTIVQSFMDDKKIEKIYAVVRPNTMKLDRLPQDSRINIIYCDYCDYDLLIDLIDDRCDVFYNLAWPRTLTYQEKYEDILEKCNCMQNVLKAVNVASKLGCRKYIGAGTQAEYGVCVRNKMSPQTPCNPVRADGAIHLAAYHLTKILCEKLNLEYVWMRIFSVYGIYDRENSMINSTLDKLLRKEHCSFTPSEQIWDYLYEDDIGKAFYLVGVKDTGNKVYCVGNGEGRSLSEYINIMGRIVDFEGGLGIGELQYPPNPIMNLCADITDLTKDTGWVPKISFEEGIRKIVDYKIWNIQ